MNSGMSINNAPNFGASYHTYFYTTDGRRIVSEQNMKKCLHYVESHLNGSKRVKNYNHDLIDTMKFGQKLPDGTRRGGDADYLYISKIRAVFDKTKKNVQGFVNIVTGKDVDLVNEKFGKPIGRAIRESKEKTGFMRSFETKDALNRYSKLAPKFAESKAVYKDGERQAFGICFTPVYNKKTGELKEFKYHHSGFFDESKVK